MTQKKKDFSATAASVFVDKMITPQEEPKAQAAAPIQAEPTAPKTGGAKRGRKPNPNRDSEERVTLIVDSSAVEKLRAIAWNTRRKFKDVVLEAMQTYLEKYEAEHGKVKTR